MPKLQVTESRTISNSSLVKYMTGRFVLMKRVFTVRMWNAIHGNLLSCNLSIIPAYAFLTLHYVVRGNSALVKQINLKFILIQQIMHSKDVDYNTWISPFV